MSPLHLAINKEREMKILSLVLIFIGYMFTSTANWVVRKFGELTYEQITFHLNVPLDTDPRLIMSYALNTVLMVAIIAFISYIILKRVSSRKSLFFAILFLLSSLAYTYNKLGIGDLLKEKDNQNILGNFYEQHYVNPYATDVKTPENKRNLIMIFAESMESTYANADYFGDNLIPELSKIAENNIHFSHNEALGGFFNIKGAKYTQASMISQLCAIPLRLPIEAARFRPKNGFLPGTLCLYDYLKNDGYNLTFLYGTSKESSGTDKFYATHGNPKILDWNFYARRDNLKKNKVAKKDKKKSYRSFFKKAIRDERLFKYAKDEIIELDGKKEPFALILMTLDTHFGTEHFEAKNCQIKYHDKGVQDKDNFKNVVSCADKQIAEFIDWIKAQPLYENTEIIIVGDHLTMSSSIFNEAMDRTVYDVYINSSLQDKRYTQNRRFTALDTLPTILESMGYIIEGHKLGLGVSLFSGLPTLLEQGISIKELDRELDKQSKIYNKILFGEIK